MEERNCNWLYRLFNALLPCILNVYYSSYAFEDDRFQIRGAGGLGAAGIDWCVICIKFPIEISKIRLIKL